MTLYKPLKQKGVVMKIWTIMGLALAVVVLEYLFFRDIIGNDRLIGNAGDSRLNNLIVEHWYKVFQGQEKWTDLIIFYPIKNTISYTDMLFGYALPYSLLRILGFNLFIANKITLILIHGLGSVAFCHFLSKHLKLNGYITLLGLIMSTYASYYAYSVSQTQIFALSFVFILTDLIAGYFSQIDRNRTRRMCYAGGAVFMLALTLYTSFYMGYFSILFMLVLSLTLVGYGLIADRPMLQVILKYIRRHVFELLLYMVWAIVLLVSFFLLYLPTAKLYGARSWQEIFNWLPTGLELFRLPSFSILQKQLGAEARLISMSLLLFFLIVLFLTIRPVVIGLRSRKKKRPAVKATPLDSSVQVRKIMLRVLALSTVLSYGLMLKIGDFSPWWLVYKLIPGATALRLVDRYRLILLIPVTICITLFLSALQHRLGSRKPLASGLILAAALLLGLDNYATPSLPADWQAAPYADYVEAVAAPPADCAVMYIIESPADATRNDYYNYQLDAWQIADHYGLKTINGYSGQFPHNWMNGIWEVSQEAYQASVDDWINQYHLEQVYAYNRVDNSWSPQRENPD